MFLPEANGSPVTGCRSALLFALGGFEPNSFGMFQVWTSGVQGTEFTVSSLSNEHPMQDKV